MGQQAIEATYLWTADEFVALKRLIDPNRRSPVVRFGMPFVAIVISFFVIVYAQSNGQSLFMGCVFAAFAFMALTQTVMGTDGAYRRDFVRSGKSAEPNTKVTIIADEEQIRKISQATDASWKWEIVPKVVETPRGFVIYLGIQAVWLPNHAFRDDHDRHAFAELALRRSASFLRV